jgi:glycosyltransferase involved in cell wall biosynthesis
LSLYCSKQPALKKIIVSVTNDLTIDQRVDKVCTTLHDEGYEVLLIGRKLKNSKPIDRNYATKRIKLLFQKGVFFYAEFNLRLFFFLLFSKKTILLANDLDTLVPNYLIGKLQRKKLVFDSHELFSEIPELVHRPFVKKIWTLLENWLLPNLKNAYTVCDSIAHYYAKKYNTKFNVIRNLPTHKNSAIRSEFVFDTSGKKVIIYQGSVNVGRGLELMIDTISFLPNCILVIVGSGDISKELETLVSKKKLENQVKLFGAVSPQKLHTITPLANLGISIEEDLGLNYRFALPNKIFDYIQAEVPVLVSDLPEMKKIITDYKVGEVVTNRTPKILAEQIEKLLDKNFSIALKTAKNDLIWEHQEQDLRAIFENLK